MPDGTLLLTVTGVGGDPVTEPVDIFLKNQTLSDNPAMRHHDLSKPKLLTGLNVAPNGRYSIELDALSYHTVSRFITIPPGGNGKLAMLLPINPKKVLSVTFPDCICLPGGIAPEMSSNARSLLKPWT